MESENGGNGNGNRCWNRRRLVHEISKTGDIRDRDFLEDETRGRK